MTNPSTTSPMTLVPSLEAAWRDVDISRNNGYGAKDHNGGKHSSSGSPGLPPTIRLC